MGCLVAATHSGWYLLVVDVVGPAERHEEVDRGPGPFADFYADWCGPCQQLEPIVEEVAATTDAAVAKVDIDRHQRLAQQHGVQGVPTIVVFSDGQPADRLVGVKSAAQLTNVIDSYR
ncbi:thioredoxin family protein [Halonotius sp. GCM10025705]|uniref:thioredoxin family protein n=1 Tax=Halonotius sp. GCM10025705 TaxID=3252678 RepID=UPI00360CC1CE